MVLLYDHDLLRNYYSMDKLFTVNNIMILPMSLAPGIYSAPHDDGGINDKF